jgi:hypothetical protein
MGHIVTDWLKREEGKEGGRDKTDFAREENTPKTKAIKNILKEIRFVKQGKLPKKEDMEREEGGREGGKQGWRKEGYKKEC